MESFGLSTIKILSLLIAMTTLSVQAKSDSSTTCTSDCATPGLHESFINIGGFDENRPCPTGQHRCCNCSDSDDDLFATTLTHDILQAAAQNSGETMIRRLLLPVTFLADQDTNIDNAITDFSVTQDTENANLFEITGFIQSDSLVSGTGSGQVHIKATIEITPDDKMKEFSLKSTGEDQQKHITLTVNLKIDDKNEASPVIEEYPAPPVSE